MNIYAVGSNQTLTDEIVECLHYILGSSLKINACPHNLIEDCLDGDIYACNFSLESTLKKYIPEEKIIIVNMQPNFHFFAKIASIPKHSKIYVFNNQPDYIETLIMSCRSKGLVDYEYIPLPYDIMSIENIKQHLSEADYIIGVDKIIVSILFKKPFYSCLKSTVMLIGAKRSASVESSALVLQKINEIAFQRMLRDLQKITDLTHFAQKSDSFYSVYEMLSPAFEDIRSALNRSINDTDESSKIIKSALTQLQL